jgi:uracil-DNA glycosylase family 4
VKLAEMTPEKLAVAPDEEVRLSWLRLSQWFGAAQAKGRSVENIVNAAVFVHHEYNNRGWQIDDRKPLAQAIASIHKDDHFNLAEALLGLPSEVVLVKDFACIVGSALSKDDPRDIDVLLRARRDDAGESFLVQADNVWLPLRKVVSPDKLSSLHFIDNPQGPHSDHIPLYSLVLRRESPEKRIVKALEPGDRFPPQKPLVAGTTEFFSTKELWPWCQKKIQAGARLAGEIKFDGFRCIIAKKEDAVSIWFEDSGEDRSEHLPKLVEAIKKLPYKSLILDGEMLATIGSSRIVPRTQLLEMLSGEPGFDPLFFAFDCLNLDEDISKRPLGERQAILKAVIDDLNSAFFCLSQPRKFSSEKELEIIGLWAASQPTSEGLVVKDLTKPYHPGGCDDWAKFKTVFEIKVQVLEKEEKNGFSYLCGLREPPGIADRTQLRSLGGQDFMELGKTFVTQLDAQVGQTLNVRIEELQILRKGPGVVGIVWGKPTVVGPDSSRDAYTVAQAVDLAKRGHVLKVEVSKEGVPLWGKHGAKIAFIASSPNEVEKTRGEPLVGVQGEIFNRLYLEPAGLQKEDVAIAYLVPQVLYEKGQLRPPTDSEIEAWTPHLMKKLDRINPKIIVTLGKQATDVLYDLSDASMPHPAAVQRFGDSGEVARKIKQIMQKVKEGSDQDGIDTRSDIAAREYERTWQQMFPPSGRGRFVLQAHWRGLSKDELNLSHEELLKTDHSVHCDLRFEIDNHQLWGFTIFEGSTKEIQELGRNEARILHLSPEDSLQGAFKLRQPHEWLTIAEEKPFISEPADVGSTSQKDSKFFQLDCGEYDFSFARLHGRELFMHGQKLKGRLLMQYAPVEGGEAENPTKRVWLISSPASQEPYTATHNLADVAQELKDKGQEYLVWADRPGKPAKVLNIQNCPFKKQRYVTILKADTEQRLVFGVVSEPDTADAQGDVLSKEEIARMAHNFEAHVREFRDRHTRRKVATQLVRSWIVKVDTWIYGQLVKAGSWVILVKVLDDDIWAKIKSGVYKAFSIGIWGVRIARRARPVGA